jgi:hypothetical protein
VVGRVPPKSPLLAAKPVGEKWGTPSWNGLVEGLILFVPAETSALVRERMANLNRRAAKWGLFEFDERHHALFRSTARIGRMLPLGSSMRRTKR